MAPASYRFPATLDPAAAPTWLDLIREANGVEPGIFAAHTTGPWWAGGTVEEYEHARVLHRPDDSVSVAATTDHGAAVLTEAATRLGIAR